MSLLAFAHYDPAAVVTKSTAAALAMTALDTGQLRRTITAPASGFVVCRLRGVIEGAATYPQVQLGVMKAAAVLGRAVPTATVCGTPDADTRMVIEVLIPLVLAAGTHVLDAAYSVEIPVASTAIKYGGPNDATADNAFGGFTFEVYAA